VLGAMHHEPHRRTCVPLVAPGVPCSVLDDNVTALQGDGLVVVDFEPNLTFNNYGIVEGRRYMHPRFVALNVSPKPGRRAEYS
jgi:hypothetical protein